MKGGIKYQMVNIDEKGRILLSKEVREELNLGNQVILELKEKELIIKPLRKIEDPLEFLCSINIKTKKTPLEMKREAEEVFGN